MPRGGPGIECPSIQGENHPSAVLTWEEVADIRRIYATRGAGITQRSLAAQYGVSPVTIHQILHNIIWRDPNYTYKS